MHLDDYNFALINNSMKHLYTEQAPKPLGPYSQAVQSGNLLFCSGQTPVDPVTMQIGHGDIEYQTNQVITNLQLVLQAAGLTLQNVIKTNVFLTDMALFGKMNEVYANRFSPALPARSTVAVRALPMDALVEIECIAEISHN